MVKLTSEVISHGYQYMNVSKEYELSLRGFKIMSIQNLSATNDQFACINLTDNSISEINMLPQLKRLKTLINRNGIPLPNDISNKTIETFLELHNLEIKDLDLIIEGKMTLPKINEEWIKYNKSCIDYYETNQYIFVHGWIPINEDKSYNKNWRKCNKNDWDNARWINGFEMSKNKIFCPGKTIVCGHVQSNFWHKEFENCEIDNFEPYISDNVILLMLLF